MAAICSVITHIHVTDMMSHHGADPKYKYLKQNTDFASYLNRSMTIFFFPSVKISEHYTIV